MAPNKNRNKQNPEIALSSLSIVKRRRRNPSKIQFIMDPTPPPMAQLTTASADTIVDWPNWISGSQLRNYILKDPLLDYLNMYGIEHGYVPVTKKEKYTDNSSFTQYIMNQGNLFEEQIINELRKTHPITTISEHPSSRSYDNYRYTLEAMKRGSPIIFQGVVRNYTDSTYGSPDLIVRSDYLENLVKVSPYEDAFGSVGVEDGEPAPLLSPTRPFHYRIVDIKFSSLHLRANGVTLLNSGSIPAYKAQVALYNRALAQMQGYLPDAAYLLGRKWEYTSKRVQIRGDSAFDRLGKVDFIGVDNDYYSLADKAISWMRDLQKNGGDWNLYLPITHSSPQSSPPPNQQNPQTVNTTPELVIRRMSRPELYPNMINRQDYPWHSVKKEIDNNVKEISSLWNCGPRNRELAHSKRIYSWANKNCTAKVLGIKGEYKSKVLQDILDINHYPEILGPVQPEVIKYNYDNWQKVPELEFFVDFEAVNDINDDFSNIPNTTGQSIVFMVGCGYEDPHTHKWIFRSFATDELTEDEEFRIFNEWLTYMDTIVSQRNSDILPLDGPLVHHWSKAERTLLSQVIKRQLARNNPEITETITTKWVLPHWFDTLDIFIKEPVTVVGALSFGLKKIARSMKDLGLIDTTWTSSNIDGVKAMISTWNMQQQLTHQQNNPDPNTRTPASLLDYPLMQEIVTYNEIDCKVIWEIVKYLRENHCP